jgi:hypothetical protein
MKLSDNLNWDGNADKLNSFLDESFKINSADDFKFIALIPYKIAVKQREVLDGMNLTAEQREDFMYGLGYDYSSEHKILLSHFYHKLKEEGLSEENLANIKKVRDGILFKMQGTPLYRDTKKLGINNLQKIWPEFNSYPKIEKDFSDAIKNMSNSLEMKKVYQLVKEEKKNLMNLSYTFFDSHYNPDYAKRDGMLPLDLRSMHNIKETIGHGCYYACPVLDL